MDLAADLGIDPEARQQGGERHRIGRAPGGGDQEAGVVVAGGRQRGGFEGGRVDAELLHEARVQRTLGSHRTFGRVRDLQEAGGGCASWIM
ncbi:hypothetical protein G6F50_017944 [Rhizopus delemar]|uniref:Uncharacterized protein n=1 Tax=Rhizopus delemar TaxID=936053 RepID=A0A9P6XNV6_9FUNG|nr:hypothetical protein G6F50_017944 [Rhizopus delemar]